MTAYEEELPQWIPFAFLLSCCVLAAALWGFLSRCTEGESGAIHPFTEHRVDLNRAGVDELMLLPGIGPRLAESIAAFRAAHGPFRSLGELEGVKGLGAVKVSALAGWVTLGKERSGQEGPHAAMEQPP